MTRGPHRLTHGGRLIDRTRLFAFSFDGRPFAGFGGDTLASALLANGVRIVGRSFKYHRPRGIWSAGVEDPNGIADVSFNGRTIPNCRLTTTELRQGMVVRSVNTWPSAQADRFAFLNHMSAFLGPGFYYKTFMWPRFASYEPAIRRMAGLGRVDGASGPVPMGEERHAACDLLIVGAGAAGLACATAAAERGLKIVVADANANPGGSLRTREAEIDGEEGTSWAERRAEALRENDRVQLLMHTTAFGVYDHGLVGMIERTSTGERLWRIRPRRTVLATGATERPMLFENNDRPGVMSAGGALTFLKEHAVIAGSSIVVATNDGSGYEPARQLARAGAQVVILDSRPAASRPHDHDLEIRHGCMVQGVRGAGGVEAVIAESGGAGTKELAADALLVAGGFTPTIHLYCQAGGVPRWNAEKGFHEPGAMPNGVAVAGAANGTLALDAALAEGHAAGNGSGHPPRSTGPSIDFSGVPHRTTAKGKRVWVDMLSDVTAADIELASREGFRSVEHLKRYTTLGMAPDQGKTSNVNGLRVLAATTGTAVADLGVTTFRPPYVPVSLATLAGRRGGERMHPLRRLPAESAHRRWGAVLSEYGGWLRPAYYPASPSDEADPIAAEALATRRDVTVFDGSSLGKIEVLGPQAEQLLDFVCYNRVSHLRPGQMRYGYMLRETGGILDDGIVVRVDDDRFIVSCSSAHVGAVADSLEEWRQSRFDLARVHIHNVTAQWGTLTVAGPRAEALLAKLAPEVGFADLRHMWMARGTWMGKPCRIARASFSGERSYEVSVPARAAAELWHALFDAGRDMGVRPLGIEALSTLRAEKGYPIVGKDTEATTMPQDVGAGGPREKRTDDFVGRRALFTTDGARDDRRQLVGLAVDAGGPPLAVGAHAVATHRGRLRSIGFVTSSHSSPNVDRPVALALLDGGASRHGEAITLQHLGAKRTAIVTHPCAYDREGARLDA